MVMVCIACLLFAGVCGGFAWGVDSLPLDMLQSGLLESRQPVHASHDLKSANTCDTPQTDLLNSLRELLVIPSKMTRKGSPWLGQTPFLVHDYGANQRVPSLWDLHTCNSSILVGTEVVCSNKMGQDSRIALSIRCYVESL
eukprot:4983267-Amphidinium_carterae.1